jgi:DNA-binding transcriptional ArsR family regulator
MSTPKPAPADSTALGGAETTICLELDSAQINQIIQAAGEGGSLALHLSQLLDGPLDEIPAQLDSIRFSRSLVLGLLTFAAFPDDGSYLGVLDIARRLGLNPSTAHRYISTLLAVGLIERDPRTRRYRRAGVEQEKAD